MHFLLKIIIIYNYNIMPGGLIQLLARGNEDIYLIYDPQITFFKIVYKRYTNFAIEPIQQNFSVTPNFGVKTSCYIAKNADLLNRIYLVVTLPMINQFIESTSLPNLNKCAWIKNIGFGLINIIELEIGGRIIDRQYGDWMYIWHELTTKCNDTQFDKIIGNVPDLISYSNKKNSYMLYVPLYFWFCRNYGQSLPLIALEFSDIKINIQFSDLDSVLNLSPNYYIKINENIIHYKSGTILYQKSTNSYLRFVYFDSVEQYLYYDKLNDNNLSFNAVICDIDNRYYVTPLNNGTELVHINKQTNFNWVNYLSLNTSYLLCDFIYLDLEERIKFARNNHEYLIEQVQFDNDKPLVGNYNKIRLSYSQPCKELIFRATMNIKNITDRFNYTLDFNRSSNIIEYVELLLNGQNRVANRLFNYFTLVQPYQHNYRPPPPGVGVYSFSLYPEEHQPSSTCNLSKIDDIYMGFTIDKSINYLNSANIRIYALSYNIFQILNGLGGLLFDN